MAYAIKFNHLSKAELEYEVLVRGGVVPEKSITVEELRKQIAKLSDLAFDEIISSCFSPDVDITACNGSLLRVSNNLLTLQTHYDKNLFVRSESIMHHVFHRLSRIDTSLLTDKSSIQVVWDMFHANYKILASFTTWSVPTNVPCHVVEPTCSLPREVQHVDFINERKMFSEICKFKYSGRTCVRAFIQKVDEFMSCRGIPEDRIFSFAFEVFCDDALHWFRSIKDSVRSWKDLCILLKRDFSPHNYDFKLMSEIRARTQGEKENITIYVSKMQGLFSCLDVPISESIKLEILLNNIRPCYTNSLLTGNIVDIPSLISVCRNFEKYDSRSKEFSEPPKITANTLAPDFAYRYPNDTNSKKTSYSNNSYKKHKYFKPTYNVLNTDQCSTENSNSAEPSVNAVSVTSTAIPKLYCPRCRTDSHSLKYCRQPRFLVCFKCGLPGYRVLDCPSCNNKTNKNSKNVKNTVGENQK